MGGQSGAGNRVSRGTEFVDQQAHLDLILAQVPLVMWTTDRDLRFVSSHGKGLAGLGLLPDQVVGRTVMEYLGQSDPEHETIVPHVAALRGQPASFEIAFGGHTWMTRVEPLRDAGGEIVGTVGLAQDITERKQAEEILVESNARLREALDKLNATQAHLVRQERLSALGQMAAGIAHDFNNALTPIAAYAELSLSTHPLDENTRVQYLRHILTAAGAAAATVARLKEFFRPLREDEQFEEVDLNLVVGETLALTQPRWRNQPRGAGVDIRVETDLGSLQSFAGRGSELREALTNLVFNAVDAMPAGGLLIVRTRLEGGEALLTVQDNGVGMSPEVMSRAMEPFFSTKGERGCGLGLSIVFGVVTRLGGKVEIESELNKGTCVSLRLPLRRPPRKSPPSGRAAVTDAAPRPLRVLVVEDEEMIRKVVCTMVRHGGHEAVPAADGRQALALLEGEDSGFDVVLTDQGMPGMTGTELAAALAGRAGAPRVVLLSGFGDLILTSGDTPPGIALMLSKPVTLEQLEEALVSVARPR